jgi:cob(I)alamin adenosyltransferase
MTPATALAILTMADGLVQLGLNISQTLKRTDITQEEVDAMKAKVDATHQGLQDFLKGITNG